MPSPSAIRAVDPIVVALPRDTPYLGPLGPGEEVNERGYFVRRGNRTIYPTVDRSVLVKITGTDGTIGWGETYGIIAPEAVVALLRDVMIPIVLRRTADDPAVIYEELYDLMRVRGGSGGFYGDALAAIDIALWDLKARREGVSLAQALGGARTQRIPAYVSGLPKATMHERVVLAQAWRARGFRGIKYAAVISREGVAAEMHALRAALGADADLMVDLHWQYSADEALALARDLAAAKPYFIEAPCAPEDIRGLARVTSESGVPVAGGEEWRNVFEATMRLDHARLAYVQPEMAHTGVSQFCAIARRAAQDGSGVIPHATIGVGIFLAASLAAASTLPDCPYHEYQHSVFDRNLQFVDTTMRCSAGFYEVATGPGHGVVPRQVLWEHIVPM
ncbi:MAG: mandelate racemase/muconate lactonizing enzyme family protein [Betaproteobacteria bacterium]